MLNHQKYMAHVINLAKFTTTQTRPNPQVAAIIVKNNEIVGIGSHLKTGGSHAEVYALDQAGELAKGATLYVNLEPCAHFGKTPPCADAIIKAGISKVVIANKDPNPLVAGLGIERLTNAGIDVICGVLENDAQQLNKVFFHNIQTKTPYVTIKAGLSLDGKIATKANISKWITGAEARIDAHKYRINHEAILVGVNTVISDNPSLTPHMIENAEHNPIRIILDTNLRTPLDSNVVQDGITKTWIVTSNQNTTDHQAYLNHNCKIITMNKINIHELLRILYAEGIFTLLIEGGEQIYSSFFDAKAVNQLVTYFSPQLIGSTKAKHLFAGSGFENLTDNIKLKFTQVEQLGNDVKLVSEVLV